jgi:hypothetical protein
LRGKEGEDAAPCAHVQDDLVFELARVVAHGAVVGARAAVVLEHVFLWVLEGRRGGGVSGGEETKERRRTAPAPAGVGAFANPFHILLRTNLVIKITVRDVVLSEIGLFGFRSVPDDRFGRVGVRHGVGVMRGAPKGGEPVGGEGGNEAGSRTQAREGGP